MKSFPLCIGAIVFFAVLAGGVVATRLLCDYAIYGSCQNELHRFFHMGDAIAFMQVGCLHSLVGAIFVSVSAWWIAKRRIACQTVQISLRFSLLLVGLLAIYFGISARLIS